MGAVTMTRFGRMPGTEIARRAVSSMQQGVRRVRRWVALTPVAVFWLTAAVVALVGCLGVLAGVGEDVLFRNGAYTTDRSRLLWFVAHRNGTDVDVARGLAVVASVPVLVALAIVVAAVLFHRRVPLAMAVAPLVALLAAGSVTAVIKMLVGRARPSTSLQLSAETSASFPSGHATDATAFLVALALVLAIVVFRRPLARVVAVVGASLLSAATAASRLVLAVHWPTDVVAGMALGAAGALATVMVAVVVTRLTPPSSAPRMRRAVRGRHLGATRRPAAPARVADGVTAA
jgi:undecaprenyl-diphosphatase